MNKSYASARASARSNSIEENKEKHKVKWNDINKGSITHISPILEHNKAMEATANSSNSDDKGNIQLTEEESKERNEEIFYQGLESHKRLSINSQVNNMRKSVLKESSSLPVLTDLPRDKTERASISRVQSEVEIPRISLQFNRT